MKKTFTLAVAFVMMLGLAQAQVDSLNPGLANDCIRTLNVADKFFEDSKFDHSYKFWQKAFQICPKDLGSSMFFMGEALLEYRLFETGGSIAQQAVLDSLLDLVNQRKELYQDEIQLQGKQSITVNRKLSALKVFYGRNTNCEYLNFKKDKTTNQFVIETYPALLWEKKFESFAAAVRKDGSGIHLNIVIDRNDPVEIKAGDIMELIFRDGTKIILKAMKSVQARKISKFNTLVYRTTPGFILNPDEKSFLTVPGNPIEKIVIRTGAGSVSWKLTKKEALRNLLECVR